MKYFIWLIRIALYPLELLMAIRHKYIAHLQCPTCKNMMGLTTKNIEDILRITHNLTLPYYPLICTYCSQEIGLNKDIFIEYIFQNKTVRQALYGHYMEKLPHSLLDTFKAYCDAHPNYDFKHNKETGERGTQ